MNKHLIDKAVLNDMEAYLKDLDYKIHWLLEHAGLYGEDGTFAFPDGETYYETKGQINGPD